LQSSAVEQEGCPINIQSSNLSPNYALSIHVTDRPSQSHETVPLKHGWSNGPTEVFFTHKQILYRFSSLRIQHVIKGNSAGRCASPRDWTEGAQQWIGHASGGGGHNNKSRTSSIFACESASMLKCLLVYLLTKTCIHA
jgi:hypothetical protein